MLPSYQDFMLPLLQLLSDGKEYKYRDMIEAMAQQFRISDEDRKEMLASGNQDVFDNRVGRAKTYLKKAGLLDSLPQPISFITPPQRYTRSPQPNKRSFW